MTQCRWSEVPQGQHLRSFLLLATLEGTSPMRKTFESHVDNGLVEVRAMVSIWILYMMYYTKQFRGYHYYVYRNPITAILSNNANMCQPVLRKIPYLGSENPSNLPTAPTVTLP